MITYKLSQETEYAQQFQDGVATGAWVNTHTNAEYLAWIATGNTPTPADVVTIVASTTPLAYIERFTEDEQLAVVTAAMSNLALRLWYDKLMAAQEVVFTDPRLAGGLDALVAAGLITAERKAELLTP